MAPSEKRLANAKKRSRNIKYIKKRSLPLELKKIPKEKLEKAKEIVNSPDDPVWYNRNISCTPGIHQFCEKDNSAASYNLLKLKYAKQCLLRRDWKNFAKVLTIFNPNGVRSFNYLFPLIAKYAAICLAHANTSQLDIFIQSMLNSTNFDGNALVKECSEYYAQKL